MNEYEARISELSDVELVRMLTTNAGQYSADELAAAEREANRRGVPIDEAFIPPADAAGDDGSEDTTPAEPCRYMAGGKIVLCAHCGGQKFLSKEILFNTRGLTFFNLDWLNRSATALVCSNCTRVELFTLPPEPQDDDAA